MKFEDVIKEKHGVWDPMLELTYNSPYLTINSVISAGKLRPAMGARNQVGIGLSYRPASLFSLATSFQTRFLESIHRPIAGLKIPTQLSTPTTKGKWWSGEDLSYWLSTFLSVF
jgi:hypothetical protein